MSRLEKLQKEQLKLKLKLFLLLNEINESQKMQSCNARK